MHNKKFPLSLIPDGLKAQVKLKTYEKNDYVFRQDSNCIYYILKGRALFVKSRGTEEEKFSPYILKKDDFIGVNSFFSGYSQWEVIASSQDLECFVIPADIFQDYILTSPVFTKVYLPKCNNILSSNTIGGYICAIGGTLPYFAYVLNILDDRLDEISFDRYSDLTKFIFTSKSNLYGLTNILIEENVIIKNRNTIKILDKKKLKSYYEDFIY